MSDGIRAEWAKLRTLTVTWAMVAGTIAATVAVSAAIIAATHTTPGTQGAGDPTKLALVGVDLGQAVIAVLAVLAVTEEYETGMIRVTLAAMPRRHVVLAAKAVTIAGLALLAAVPAVAGCLIAGRLLLPAAGLGPAHGDALLSVAHGPTLRAAIGCVLYLSLVGLIGLGVGAIFRETGMSTGIVLGLLYLPPLLAHVISGPWQRHVEQIAPMTAGLAIQATRNLRALPLAPWAGLGVLAAWAAGVLVLAAGLLRFRDA